MYQRQETGQLLNTITIAPELDSTRAKPGDTIEERHNVYLRIPDKHKEMFNCSKTSDPRFKVTGMRFRGNQLIEIAVRGNNKYAWIEFNKLNPTQFQANVRNTLWDNWLTIDSNGNLVLKPNVNLQAVLDAEIEKKQQTNTTARKTNLRITFLANLLNFETIQFTDKDPLPTEAVRSIRRSIAGRAMEQDGLEMRALGIGYRIRTPKHLQHESIVGGSMGIVSGIAIKKDTEQLVSIGLRVNCRDQVLRFYHLPFATRNLESIYSQIITKSQEELAFNFAQYIKIEEDLIAEPGFVDALLEHAKARGLRNPSELPTVLFDWNAISPPLEEDIYLMGLQEVSRYNRVDERKYKSRPEITNKVVDEFKEEKLVEVFLKRKIKFHLSSDQGIFLAAVTLKQHENGGWILVGAHSHAKGKQQRLSFIRPNQLPAKLTKIESDGLAKWDFIKPSDDYRYFIVDTIESLHQHIETLFQDHKSAPILPRVLLSVDGQMLEAEATTSSITSAQPDTAPIQTTAIDVPAYFYLEVPRKIRRDTHIRGFTLTRFNLDPSNNQLISVTLSYEQKEYMTVFFKKGTTDINPPFDRLIEVRENNFFAKANFAEELQRISELKQRQLLPTRLLNWEEGAIQYVNLTETLISKRKKHPLEGRNITTSGQKHELDEEEMDESQAVDSETASPPQKRAHKEEVPPIQVRSTGVTPSVPYATTSSSFFSSTAASSNGPDPVLFQTMLRYFLARCEQSSSEVQESLRKVVSQFYFSHKEQLISIYPEKTPFYILDQLTKHFETIKQKYGLNCELMRASLSQDEAITMEP